MDKKKDTKPVGRPPKIDDVVLGKLESAFLIGASDRQACKHAGINPDTLYEYQKKHPEFTERKEMLKENPILKAKFAVFKGLDDPKLALDYLKLRDDDFVAKTKSEVKNTTPQIVVANETDLKALEELKNADINKRIS